MIKCNQGGFFLWMLQCISLASIKRPGASAGEENLRKFFTSKQFGTEEAFWIGNETSLENLTKSIGLLIKLLRLP